ncbi:hypothetical protein H1164_03790 [Thermoactinomyces daqus]|uniref:Uncharacterized protein n=1 Tax=Thermoactinomyces daqus TaxID=1329516 RepID=A0A7W2AHP0_9BACL|nr:hypothetical protein [Thermoactinomyces daqus]MBA4542023.1 hypothetical protein [Thermoactinomyces daqus]
MAKFEKCYCLNCEDYFYVLKWQPSKECPNCDWEEPCEMLIEEKEAE